MANKELKSIKKLFGRGLGRRTFSLRWGFLSILLLCWVLPIVLFSGAIIYVITENVGRNTGDAFTYSFDSYARQSRIVMQNALSDSRAVSYDGVVRREWQNYLGDKDYVGMYADITSYMSGRFRRSSEVMDAWIFFTDEPDRVLSVSNQRAVGTAQRLANFRLNDQARVTETAKGLGTDFRFLPTEGGLLLIRNLVTRDYTPFAVLVLNLDAPRVFSIPIGSTWENVAVVMDGERVYGDGEIPAFAEGLADKEIRLDSGFLDYSISKRQDLEGHETLYAARLSDLPFQSRFSPYYYIAIFIVLMTIVLTLIFMRFFYRNITAPVQDLAAASAQISGGALGYQTSANYGGAEFNELASAMNGMSSQLKEMFEQSIKEQIALQDARIGALQSQINPHFLNNTLEIITWEARMTGAERASAMLEALSTMLSAAMGRDGNSLVRLEEELRYLDSYLYIVSVRLSERLTVERQIDGAFLGTRVPRLILQPLVENAIEHGISKLPKGSLSLRIYGGGGDVSGGAGGGNLIIDVVNDFGGGTDAELSRIRAQLKEEAQPGDHIGVGNVHRRLRLVFGESAGLSYHEEKGGRICARIEIPLP